MSRQHSHPMGLKVSHASHRLKAWIASLFLSPDTITEPGNFTLWERRGYHITPNHFYHPIPDSHALEGCYPAPSSLSGIDLREEFQLNLLRGTIPQYADEYNSFPLKEQSPHTFFLHNDGFCGIDPHVYYSFIRHFKPQRIIEVGSGHSTLLGFQAAQLNDPGCRLTVIDPWPRGFIRSFFQLGHPGIEHLPQRVEVLDVDIFACLEENDILFIDSSHVVRTGGDICFLILEVLPRLSKGVLVHFHDIYLPQEYPKEIILEQHMFWTEQYLLQAYLAENEQIEVFFGCHHMAERYPEAFRSAFPNAIWWTGTSFWLRRC